MRHDVRAVARRNGARADTVVPFGAGLDNTAYLVDGDLVVRFRTADGDGLDVVREARLLETVAGIVAVPVPVPEFVDEAARCVAYRRLPGVPLLEMPERDQQAHRNALLETLTEVLRALQETPVERFDVEVDDEPPAAYLAELSQYKIQISGPEVDAFLASAAPERAGELRFSHNDLGIEHVLVDPETFRITGIIDWTDAAVCDPAYDYGLLLRDLGPFGLPAGYEERAWFYARCSLLEDLHHGRHGQAAVARLFTSTGG